MILCAGQEDGLVAKVMGFEGRRRSEMGKGFSIGAGTGTFKVITASLGAWYGWKWVMKGELFEKCCNEIPVLLFKWLIIATLIVKELNY